MKILVGENYSNEGKVRFYNLMEQKRIEISELSIFDEEKSKLSKMVDETIRNYEQYRIKHVNRILQVYRKEIIDITQILDKNRSLFN